MSGPHVLKEARGGKAHQAPLSRIFRIAQMNQFEDDPSPRAKVLKIGIVAVVAILILRRW
jgi:hypothetical protein